MIQTLKSAFQTFGNAWKVPELRTKLLFVFLILVLYRIGAVMPVPFVNSAMMNVYLETMGSGSIFTYLNILSGSAFGNATLFALSVSPYITASIVVQLLDVAFPRWFGGREGRNAEPESKRKKMTFWTRIFTVILAVLTSFGYYMIMKNNGILTSDGETPLGACVIIVCYCTGAALIMWLAEKIEERGIGNGISMILLANILSSVGGIVSNFIYMIQSGFASGVWNGVQNIGLAILSVAITLAIIMLMIYVTGSERRIPVKYAKRVVGRKMYGGQTSHLPLKVNMSGVMPVIFASSIVALPSTVLGFIYGATVPEGFWDVVVRMFNPNSDLWYVYTILLFVLIVMFSYFYTTISFDPDEVANNLQRQGGQIPGIRQGSPTADYIRRILRKITLMGALFLSFISIFPILVSWIISLFGITFASIAFGGTSLLIVVGVIQETAREIEAQLTMRNYKGFLK